MNRVCFNLSAVLIVGVGLIPAASARAQDTPGQQGTPGQNTPAQGVETAAQDQAAYDALYRDKLVAVRRSRSRDDDAELIGQMLDTAQSIPDSPGVQRLIYHGAMALGIDSDLYGQAIESATAFRERFPEDPAMTDTQLLLLYEQAYRATRGTERQSVAEPYLDLLLSLASSAEAENDLAVAEARYRSAYTVARSVDSPRLESIANDIRRFNAIEDIRSRVRELVNAVDANPRNNTAARDLVELLVLFEKDVEAAAVYVDRTEDADLIDVVKMSLSGPGGASAPEAVRVGDWYFALAQEDGDYTDYALAQVVVYYQRFLSIYSRNDALKTRVQGMADATNLLIEQRQTAVREAARGQWGDLIDAINPRRDLLGDNVRVQSKQVISVGGVFVTPAQVHGDYDLRIRLRFDSGEDGLVIYLPLGDDHAVTYHYSRWKHTRSQFVGGGRNDDGNLMLTPGREVQLDVEVRMLDGQRVSLLAKVDGHLAIEWVGPLSDLHTDEHHTPPQEHRGGFAFSCGGRFSFSAIEFRQPE